MCDQAKSQFTTRGEKKMEMVQKRKRKKKTKKKKNWEDRD